MGQAMYKLQLSSGDTYGPASLEMVAQWAREGRVPVDALLVPVDGSRVRSVLSEPALKAILSVPTAPPTSPPGPRPGSGQDAPMASMIPYKNPPALIGYYMGVFSFVPLLGMVLALPAIILGIIGLVKRRKNPKVRGAAHAVLAIVFGVLGPAVWLLLFVLVINQ